MTMINGIDLTLTGNPNADLKTYMQARGCDQATAKEELEAQFGIPQMLQNSQDEESVLSDDADFQISGDPQEDLIKYAELNSIDTDTAKKN